jgi:hypothetical protein
MSNDLVGIIARNKNIYNLIYNYLINNNNYGIDNIGIYIKNDKNNFNNNLIKFSILDNENVFESLRKFKMNTKNNIGIGQTNIFNNNKPMNIYGPLKNEKIPNKFTMTFSGKLNNKKEITNFLEIKEITINDDIEIPFYLFDYLLKNNYEIENIRKNVCNLYKILEGNYCIMIVIDNIDILYTINKNNNLYITEDFEKIIMSNFFIVHDKIKNITSDIIIEIDKEFNINLINNNIENIFNEIIIPENHIINEYLNVYEKVIYRRYYNNKIIIPKLNNIKKIKNIGKIILITDKYSNISKYLINLINLHFNINVNLFVIINIENNETIKKYINNNDDTNIIILFGLKNDNISVEDNYSKIFVNKTNEIFKNSYNDYKILIINSIDIITKSKLNIKYYDCILETNLNQEYHNAYNIIFLSTLLVLILRKIKKINKDEYKLFINYINNFLNEYKNIKEEIIKKYNIIKTHSQAIKKYNDIYVITNSTDIENIYFYDLISNNYNICLYNTQYDKIIFKNDNYYIINFDKNYNKFNKNCNRKFDIFNFHDNFKIKPDIFNFFIFVVVLELIIKF